ncbi:MAG: deaminase, partial [Candidatus Sumerlaeales bacterium]|nr:deaminase [Candidatus Sumerlaeales bacterium]
MERKMSENDDELIDPMIRRDWHSYFMDIAREVASRATCDRKKVGAVIVREKTILSTGYNGSIR